MLRDTAHGVINLGIMDRQLHKLLVENAAAASMSTMVYAHVRSAEADDAR
jgi:hypothetical protein